MIQRFLNALATRLRRDLRAEIRDAIEESRDADRKEVRALVAEMDDMLEKFNRMVARQAMRRSRETKAAAESFDGATPDAAPAPAAPVLHGLDRKAALRARIAGRAAPTEAREA